MAAFLSNTNFLTRYDSRTIGDLVSDDGTRTSAGSLANDANLETALEDASGEILSAAMRGERYSEADLAGLTGNGLAFLERLTADLAIYFLVLRRGKNLAEYPQATRARETLDLLEKGKRIFAIDEAADKGHAQPGILDTNILLQQNHITDTNRMFPVRRVPNNF